jgi:hypothetical protein
MSRQTALWALAALLGLVLTAGITWATSQLTSQHIGLSSEPISGGRSLAPAVTEQGTSRGTTTRKRPRPRPKTTSSATTVTTTPSEPTVSQVTPAPATSSTPGAGSTRTSSSTAPTPTSSGTRSGSTRDDSRDGGGEGGEAPQTGGQSPSHGRDD